MKGVSCPNALTSHKEYDHAGLAGRSYAGVWTGDGLGALILFRPRRSWSAAI
jgi:hypothetical protein